jgi:hypothetical protein
MSDPAADAVETYAELTAVVTDAFTAIVADPQVVA